MDAHTKQKVLDYLKSGYVITQADGLSKLGTTCAKDYCGVLRRKHGIPIQSKWETNPISKKRYKIYWLQQA